MTMRKAIFYTQQLRLYFFVFRSPMKCLWWRSKYRIWSLKDTQFYCRRFFWFPSLSFLSSLSLLSPYSHYHPSPFSLLNQSLKARWIVTEEKKLFWLIPSNPVLDVLVIHHLVYPTSILCVAQYVSQAAWMARIPMIPKSFRTKDNLPSSDCKHAVTEQASSSGQAPTGWALVWAIVADSSLRAAMMIAY